MSSVAKAQAEAPAKINLLLEVLGRRADGFHDLRTLMLAVNLCDQIEVSWRAKSGVALTVDGPHASADIPNDTSNLVVRMAHVWLQLHGEARGIEIELTKNIPSQAGLGGGSSDAVAVLAALDELRGETTSRAWQREQLTQLGSDCVFFLDAELTGLALCEGRGERVSPLPAINAEWFIAVVTPLVRVPTSAAFRALEFPLSGPAAASTVLTQWSDVSTELARTWSFNHLEEAAQRAVPALVAWRQLLDDCDAGHFRLTGSGSSFFGLFPTRVEAQASLDRVVRMAASRGLDARGAWVLEPYRTSG